MVEGLVATTTAGIGAVILCPPWHLAPSFVFSFLLVWFSSEAPSHCPHPRQFIHIVITLLAFHFLHPNRYPIDNILHPSSPANGVQGIQFLKCLPAVRDELLQARKLSSVSQTHVDIHNQSITQLGRQLMIRGAVENPRLLTGGPLGRWHNTKHLQQPTSNTNSDLRCTGPVINIDVVWDLHSQLVWCAY